MSTQKPNWKRICELIAALATMIASFIGGQAFAKFKIPLGFYAECAPGGLLKNEGTWQFKAGTVVLY